jgi:hypothetical protein
MKTRFTKTWLQILALLFVVSVAHAQPAQPVQENFSQPELEQMLAPIALYPDALLSQILMASTYPAEVVEASYWIKANPGLKGEAAVRAARNEQWDISVKSLLPFPQVLGTMESKFEWTQNLGNAFLGQEQQVMDTIQSLRQKAMAAGYLKSDSRIRVVQQDRLISINLVRPTAVYVPYYNPTVVYGTWWAPQYAPVYWEPWQGYAAAPGYHGWAWAGVATVVTVGILYGAFNWRSRNVYYGRNVSYWSGHRDYDRYRVRSGSQTRWTHDATHRRDIPYRSATINQRYGPTATAYNAKVGPRPTVQDLRTGKHTIKPVSTTSTRNVTTRSGRTITRATTGRTAVGATGSRTRSTATGTSTRKAGTGPGATGGKSHAKPKGVAHGVRGTQPSAGTKARGNSGKSSNGGKNAARSNKKAAPHASAKKNKD